MITKKDLDGAIENMIRQVSLVIVKAFENIVTKNDLKIFATKDDLNKLEKPSLPLRDETR